MAAGEIASACGAERLIFLTDVAGILDDQGNLLSRDQGGRSRGAPGQEHQAAACTVKAQAVLQALAGGVRAVHIVDGRAPHSVVAELFTDHGVGTLVT